jgi:metal-dependent amidase/aminoacylase/carboxypeptidase family protein
MTRTVHINRDRLWASLMELRQIGAYDDDATGLRGVRCLALTDADAEARRRCVDWMLQAGLKVRVDHIGNAIPHQATLTIDLRNPADGQMTAAEQHLASYVREFATRHGVQVAWERMAKTAVVPFDLGIQDLLAATAGDLGLPYVRAMSGAGHDAQEISAICPTAMVFVAGEHGGISHTPREYSSPGGCANGTDVLGNTVLRLADQP